MDDIYQAPSLTSRTGGSSMQPPKSKDDGHGPQVGVGGLQIDCLTSNFLSFLSSSKLTLADEKHFS